ncbi:MAG: SdrD B-like domain-containing protein [Microcoleaceae cyanobacterium]
MADNNLNLTGLPLTEEQQRAANQVVSFPQVIFGNKAPTIVGTKFNDSNANGVRDPNENGIGGVTVFVDLNNDSILQPTEPSAVTNADGSYTIPNAINNATNAAQLTPLTPYTVREVVPANSRPTTPNPVVAFIPTNANARVDFGNISGGNTIVGCKFLDLNGDGKRTGNEPGIAGVKIFLDTNNNGKWEGGEAYSVTNQFGEFTFTNLPAGTYRVREEGIAGYPQSTPPGNIPNLDVVLTGTGSTANPFQVWGCALVGDTPTYTINIKKYRDDNANGIQDANEPPIANTPFYIDLNRNAKLDASEPTALSDANGIAAFRGLAPGGYSVRENISAAPFQVPTSPNNSVVEVTAPGPLAVQSPLPTTPTDPVPATLPWDATVPRTYQVQTSLPFPANPANLITYSQPPANASATGPVGNARPNLNVFKFIDLNANGIYEPFQANGTTPRDINPFLPGLQAETPQAGVRFFIDLNGDGVAGTNEPTATTDANGNASFQALTPGSYQVREVVPGGFTPSTPNPVTVPIANQDARVIFGDTPNSNIKGCKFLDLNNNGYRDGNEPGLSGIRIFLDQNNNGLPDDGAQFVTTTDKDGNWQFSNLSPGAYRVREVAPTNSSQTTPAIDILLGPNETFSCAPVGNSQFYDLYVKKFQDNNRNGIQDNGEPPLQNVPFILDLNGNQKQEPGEPSAATDANGIAVFRNIPAGTYSVFELQPFGLQIGTTPNPYQDAAPGPRALIAGTTPPPGFII